jgi:predicted aspartyl protease
MKRLRTLILPAVLLFTESALAREQPLHSIPFHLTERGHVIVEAIIDENWTLPMVVDTGAYYAVLPEQAVERLAIPVGAIDAITATTASDTRSIRRVAVDSISVAGVRMEAVQSLLTDLPMVAPSGEIPGVLPLQFLERYTVHFDLANSRLELYDPALELAERLDGEQYSRVPFRRQHGFVSFEVSINGEPMPAILDTGASGDPIINWQAAMALGVGPDHEGLVESREIKGVGRTGLSSRSYEFDSVRVGQEKLLQSRVDIADMPHFRQLIGSGPAVNMGLLQMGRASLYISYSQELLYLDIPGEV